MADVLDIRVDQGSRWRGVIKPTVDWLSSLAGYSARGKVKTSRTLPGAGLLLDLTAYLTVDVSSGTVLLDIPASATVGVDWDSGQYDLELFDGNPAHDIRFLQGAFVLDKEVTT